MEAPHPRRLAPPPQPPAGRADLHVHSRWSDGGQTPEAIVRAAAGCLDVVAIGTARGHRSIGRLIPDLSLDAIEVVNNAGVFSQFYDARAALRNLEWMLPVTAGSDAHDVWCLGSAFTVFPGHDATDLRRALGTGRTRAVCNWSWSVSKMPRHLHIQVRSVLRFLRRWRQRRAVVGWVAPTVSLRQGGHRGHP